MKLTGFIDIIKNMSSNKIIKGAGFIIYYNNKFLVIKDRAHNNFGFPKGHAEPGETTLETALRELQEETGINKNDINIIKGFSKSVKYTLPDGTPKEVVYYLANLKSDFDVNNLKLSGEIKSIKFLTCDKAKKTITFKATSDLIDEAMKYL